MSTYPLEIQRTSKICAAESFNLSIICCLMLYLVNISAASLVIRIRTRRSAGRSRLSVPGFGAGGLPVLGLIGSGAGCMPLVGMAAALA